MSTLFDDLMGSAGVAMLFDTSGEIVVVTPQGGTAVELTAVLGNVRTVLKQTGGSSGGGLKKVQQRECTITDSASGPYGGIAEPLLNAKVTIAGASGEDESWSVVEPNQSRGGLWRLVIERSQAVEKTRPNFRGER